MKKENMNLLSGKSGAVFEELESRFKRAHYKFGELLSPVDLAEEFGVSLQPIRAALSQLRALGFIVVTPQVGCKVISPSHDDIHDFFRMFGHMQGVIASLAAERRESADIEKLEWVTERLLKCKIAVRGVPEIYSDLVGEWHATIIDIARSPSLGERFKPFWNMSEFLLWQGAPNVPRERLQTANAQRQIIVDAIRRGDAMKAEALMIEHVRGKPQRVPIEPKPEALQHELQK